MMSREALRNDISKRVQNELALAQAEPAGVNNPTALRGHKLATLRVGGGGIKVREDDALNDEQLANVHRLFHVLSAALYYAHGRAWMSEVPSPEVTDMGTYIGRVAWIYQSRMRIPEAKRINVESQIKELEMRDRPLESVAT